MQQDALGAAHLVQGKLVGSYTDFACWGIHFHRTRLSRRKVTNSFAVVATGETWKYGNVTLKKCHCYRMRISRIGREKRSIKTGLAGDEQTDNLELEAMKRCHV